MTIKILLAALILIPHSIQATVVQIDDLGTMAKKSEVVIQGVVADQHVKKDQNGRIVTLSTLQIVDGIKGAKKGDYLTIYQVGGNLNGESLWVSGAQRYQLGEEVVLFGLNIDGMVVSYGVGLGKFKILREGPNAQVVEDLNDLVEAKPTSKGDLVYGEPVPRRFPTLEAFKGAIRESLANPGGRVLRKKGGVK